MARVSMYRLASGAQRWRAVWELPAGPDGKRRVDSKAGFVKMSEAKDYAAKMAVEVEQRGVGDPERHDVERFLKRYQATCRHSGDYSITTLVHYANCARRISAVIGHILLKELTPAHVDEALGSMLAAGLSPGTVRATYAMLSTALTRARRWRLIAANPCEDARPPKMKKRRSVRSLTREEASRILAAIDNPPRRDIYPALPLLVRLALGTGLRRGELLGLCFDCIDFERGQLTVRRTVIEGEDRVPILRDGVAKTSGSLRTIALSPQMLERLRVHRMMILEQKLQWGKEYAAGPLLVFPDAGGVIMKPAAMDHMLRSLLKRAGVVGAQPAHVYRHSHASWLIRDKHSATAVSKRMGHTSPAFTLAVYSHPEPIEDDEVAAAMEGMVDGANRT